MKIVTLIENYVSEEGLFAEHGLSFYIETDTQSILFDTGQSGLFIKNAEKLGLNLRNVDSIILSHGHYDHTGGLIPFLEYNNKAKVHAKKNLFTPKYKSKTQFIGSINNKEVISNRLVITETITEIAQNVFLMPNINIYSPADTNFKNFFTQDDNKLIFDSFDDELFMVIKQSGKINIITACSHRGITNICKTATDYFNLSVNLILGGFHMKNCSDLQYQEIMQYLKKLNPASIGVCHCTGIDRYADMRNSYSFEVFYNYTGKKIII